MNGLRCLLGADLGPVGEQLVQPVDAHVAIRTAAGTAKCTSLVLDAPVLAARVSPAMLHALKQLGAALGRAIPPSPPPSNSNPAARAPDVLADDLRCGLMELAPIAASRPGNPVIMPRHILQMIRTFDLCT